MQIVTVIIVRVLQVQKLMIHRDNLVHTNWNRPSLHPRTGACSFITMLFVFHVLWANKTCTIIEKYRIKMYQHFKLYKLTLDAHPLNWSVELEGR